MTLALVPIFHGKVSPEGVLGLLASEARQYRQHLLSVKGQDVEVVIRRQRSKRSAAQNKYWHAVPFPMLAEYLGYDSLERLKLDLLGECFGWVRSTVTGHDTPVICHTSDLTVEQGVRFTDWMVMWAASEFNFKIPLPDEAEPA